MQLPCSPGCEVRGAKSSFDGVVVGDGDDVQPAQGSRVVDQLRRCRPAVARGCVEVKVSPTPGHHGVCMVRPTGLPSKLLIRYSAHQSWEVPAVEGLMQDYELSLQHVLWRIERLHPQKEVVTKREQGGHRIKNRE